MIRVTLPAHLRSLAGTGREVSLEVASPVTQASVLNALEAAYPVLKGAVRHYGSGRRRDFVRFFVDGEDWSLESAERLLPDSITSGREPFRIIGAIAGG